MKKAILNISILLLFIATSSNAFAEKQFYVGGGIGQSYIEQDNVFQNEDFDEEDFAFKAFAGYRFHKHFAGEVDYLDFGEPDDTISALGLNVRTTIEAYALAMYLVGILPLAEKFEVFGKLGAAYWDADAEASALGVTGRQSEDGTDFAYGAGASYAFTDKFVARIEYEGIDADDLEKLDMLTVSGEIRF